MIQEKVPDTQDSLLNLIGGLVGDQPLAAAPAPLPTTTTNNNLLMDLLGLDSDPVPVAAAVQPAIPPLTAVNKQGLLVGAYFRRLGFICSRYS